MAASVHSSLDQHGRFGKGLYALLRVSVTVYASMALTEWMHLTHGSFFFFHFSLLLVVLHQRSFPSRVHRHGVFMYFVLVDS